VTELFGIAATAALFGLFGYMGTRKSWRFDGCEEGGECGDCHDSCLQQEGPATPGGGKAAAWWSEEDVRRGEEG